VLIVLAMRVWLWGRLALLICAARSTSLMLSLGAHAHSARAGDPQLASAFKAAGISVTDEGLSESTVQPRPSLGRLGQGALGAALSLADAGALATTPSVGLFVTAGRSLLDSEPLSAELGQGERPLELPHAFLHAVSHFGFLPRVSILFSVEFTSGIARMRGPRRATVRRISTSPAVFSITLRYGWAELPKTGSEVCDVLHLLGVKAYEPGSRAPELASLAHLACWAPPDGSSPTYGCHCGTEGCGACLPITFVILRDVLAPPRGAFLVTRLSVAAFNLFAAVCSTSADFIKLPPAACATNSLLVAVPQTEVESAAGRAAWSAETGLQAEASGMRLRRTISLGEP
jgi:hypothetical protein